MKGSKFIPARGGKPGAKSARFGRKTASAPKEGEGEQLTKEGLKQLILDTVKQAFPVDLLTEAKAKALVTSIIDEKLTDDDDKPISAKSAKAIAAEALSQAKEAAEAQAEVNERKKSAKDKKAKAAKTEDDEGGEGDEGKGDDDDTDGELSQKEVDAAIAAAKKAKSAKSKKAGDENTALTMKGATELFSTMFDGLLEKIQAPSRKQFGEGEDADLHVYMEDGERSGNLALHKKQLLNACLLKNMNDGIRDSDLKVARAKGARDLDRLAATRYAGFKALTVAGAASGAELVPSDLSSQLYRRIYLESPLAQYMLAREIQMPTDNYTFPLRTTRPKFYHRGNSVAAIESTPGTGEFTLIAKKLMAKVSFEYELEEDSIVPVLPMILDDLGGAAAEAWESSIVNGDTTATHQDSDIHAIAGAPEKAYVGLRKMCLAGSLVTSFASGGIDKANTTALRKMLKKYGRNPRDLVWLCGIQGYNDMISLDEVFTLDKFGQRATVQTGELFFYKGVQIMLCSGIREDLNASGVYDGVTTTKGSFMLANLSNFITGRRRDFTIEMDKDISNQTKWLVASFRKAFSTIETPSLAGGITPVSLGYNYSS